MFIIILAGANWRQLTETDKIPYDKLAEVERQKYEAAMREYSQVTSDEEQINNHQFFLGMYTGIYWAGASN